MDKQPVEGVFPILTQCELRIGSSRDLLYHTIVYKVGMMMDGGLYKLSYCNNWPKQLQKAPVLTMMIRYPFCCHILGF